MDPAEAGGILPRGRHNLSAEEVADSQQARMRRAAIEEVADLGLTAATVGGVVRRARVSRETFYRHASNLMQCYGEALDAAVRDLGRTLGTPAGGSAAGAGPHALEERLTRLLAAVDGDRPAARCLFLAPGRPPVADVAEAALVPVLQEALPGATSSELTATARLVVALVADAVEAGAPAGDLREPVLAYVAARRA